MKCGYTAQGTKMKVFSAALRRNPSIPLFQIVAVDFGALLGYYRKSCSFTIWGRNGFDGDKEAQVAYQAPAGL